MKNENVMKDAAEAMGILQANVKEHNTLTALIDDYIDFIYQHVPDEFMADFGVGYVSTHPQFDDVIGYCNEAENKYVVTGKGYYHGGDWNYYVYGSNWNDELAFAKEIPAFVENGLKCLKIDTEKTIEAKSEVMKAIENLRELLIQKK